MPVVTGVYTTDELLVSRRCYDNYLLSLRDRLNSRTHHRPECRVQG